MSRYPLNLPGQLKKEAEQWASQQGVSLNQFIMWSVAEKVGALRQMLDDPEFPKITYRRGSAGIPTAVIGGTGVRVQTLVVAKQQWGMTIDQISSEYDLTQTQIRQALNFYQAHKDEVDIAIAAERELEAQHA